MRKNIKLHTICLATVMGALALSACSDKTSDTTATATDAAAAPDAAASDAAAPAAAPAAVAAPSLDALQGLKVDEFGPKTTKAGVAFNEQPDGSSAIWVRADRELEGYDAAVWFNGQRLGGRGVSKGTVSGTIPKELLAKAGTYPVEIRIGEDGTQLASDKVDFIVE